MANIAIISDTHFGGKHYTKVDKDTGLNRYMIKTLEIMESILQDLKKDGVDTIIIPGDTFDIANPTTYVLERVNKMFEGFNVYAILGNHDSTSLLKQKQLGAIDLVGFNTIHRPVAKVIHNINFVFIPWGFEIDQSLVDPSKKNILIIHGFIQQYGYEVSNENIIDCSKLNGFDLVLAGHLHDLDIVKHNNTTLISPGSIMPSVINEDYQPGYYLLDTNSNELARKMIKNPVRLHKYTTEDPNEVLIKINKEDVYRITTNTLPDTKLLFDAKQIALDIKIKFDKKEDDKKEIKKVGLIWEYMKDKYPEYLEEFKDIYKTLV